MYAMKLTIAFVAIAAVSAPFGNNAFASDKKKTVTQGAVIGCVAGAALAKILKKDDGKELATGCVAGAVVGGVYGNHVANKKADYLTKELYFEAVIDSANAVALQANKDHAFLLTKIDHVKNEQIILETKKLNALRKIKYKAKQAKRTRKAISATGQAIARVSDEIEIQKVVLAEQRSEAPVLLVAASEEGISTLEAEKRALQILEAELHALDNRRSH